MVLANVVHSLDTGGAERLVVDMSLEFAREHQVVVVCLDRIGNWGQELRAAGVPVHLMRRQPGLDLYLAFRLSRLFRELSVDIVHAHQTAPWFYTALSRYFYRYPRLLFEEHGRHYPERDSIPRRVFNRLLIAPKTDLAVAVSEDIRQRLVRFEGLAADRIQVVYNGAHDSGSPARDELNALRRELGIDEKDFVIGFVGRLDPIKNIPMLLDSMSRLRTDGQAAKCLIVGDGSEMPGLQERVRTLGIDRDVVFAGFRSDVSKLNYIMDVFVLPSFSEGTSMALLEAMAAGVPVVATRVGGNTELIEDGISGYLVESDSVDELTTALEKIAGSPELRTEFAATARAEFEARFSFEAMIEAYSGLYGQLAEQLPAPFGSEAGS
jgi:sugar transferase (PEP-CTERM/EpsH1 system associated)